MINDSTGTTARNPILTNYSFHSADTKAHTRSVGRIERVQGGTMFNPVLEGFRQSDLSTFFAKPITKIEVRYLEQSNPICVQTYEHGILTDCNHAQVEVETIDDTYLDDSTKLTAPICVKCGAIILTK